MATYNGFKNRSQWNQSLWINNDEGLYRLAKACISDTENRAIAIETFIYNMIEIGRYSTPDGYKWSKAGVRAAMVGL